MNNVLSRGYIAEDVTGNEFIIRNIVDYISSIGIESFERLFGFDFGKVTYSNEYHCIAHKEGETVYGSRKVAKYQYQYRLKDGCGRYYSPDYIVSEFRRTHPKIAKTCQIDSNGLWGFWGYRYGTRRMRKAALRAEYSSTKWKRSYWQASLNSEDEGISPVRNLMYHYRSVYDDDMYRKPEKSWKKYRKTQYR